jgi:hypothetical protein
MDLRKIFTFDATHRTVRLKGCTVLKAESGEISFDDITEIGTEKICPPGSGTGLSVASRSSPREPQAPWLATAR